jgi:hypothetical protein
LRALNESNVLFVPMPIVARVSSYGAVAEFVSELNAELGAEFYVRVAWF